MNDFSGLLNSDYGFKPSGKSAPMCSSSSRPPIFDLESTSTSNSLNGLFPDNRDPIFRPLKAQDFENIFGGSARFSGNSPFEAFNLDSMYGGTSDADAKLSDSVAVRIPQRLWGCRKSAQSPISDIVGQIKEWCCGLSENNDVLRFKHG